MNDKNYIALNSAEFLFKRVYSEDFNEPKSTNAWTEQYEACYSIKDMNAWVDSKTPFDKVISKSEYLQLLEKSSLKVKISPSLWDFQYSNLPKLIQPQMLLDLNDYVMKVTAIIVKGLKNRDPDGFNVRNVEVSAFLLIMNALGCHSVHLTQCMIQMTAEEKSREHQP